MITGILIKTGTYNEGTFTIELADGQEVICHLHNKERDWDKLYDYLSKEITLKGSIMVAGHFVVMEIIE